MSEDPLVISLKERERAKSVKLTSSEASALEEFSERFLSGNAKVVRMSRSSSTEWDVEAATCIGAARIPVPGGRPIHLHIHPKLPIHRILMLLAYDTAPKWDEHTIPLPEAQPLLPAMAEAFTRTYDRANRMGPPQAYRMIREERTTVRGRILPEEQTRRRGPLAFPLNVEFDDLTTDLPENRLLLSAAMRLTELPDVSPSVKRSLSRIARGLSEVVPLAPDEPLPRWEPSSRNRFFVPALRLAEAILRESSANHEGRGQVPIDGFLFNPETYFERFLADRIGERLPAGRRLKHRDSSYTLDHAGKLDLIPDLVLYGSGRPIAVLDAKYKDLDSAGNPARKDLYQMVAYCAGIGAESGHLIYAFGDVGQGHEEHFVKASGITVHIHSVKLSDTREEIASRFDRLVETLPTTTV